LYAVNATGGGAAVGDGAVLPVGDAGAAVDGSAVGDDRDTVFADLSHAASSASTTMAIRPNREVMMAMLRRPFLELLEREVARRG
jgi:hypothetical protein